LSDNYHVSLPITTPPNMQVISRVNHIKTLNKQTGSELLSDKIVILHFYNSHSTQQHNKIYSLQYLGNTKFSKNNGTVTQTNYNGLTFNSSDLRHV